jgi:uncharacterized protein YuzE
MKGPIDIYYDPEGDLLEIAIVPTPRASYCQDVHEDVFLRRSEATHDIVGIGILNFKHHPVDLRKV